MHDINDLELRGVPGMFIASTEFVEAAAAQSESLGFKPLSVFVQHPIQDRTDEEMATIADHAFEEILNALVEQG